MPSVSVAGRAQCWKNSFLQEQRSQLMPSSSVFLQDEGKMPKTCLGLRTTHVCVAN